MSDSVCVCICVWVFRVEGTLVTDKICEFVQQEWSSKVATKKKKAGARVWCVTRREFTWVLFGSPIVFLLF